MKKSQNHRAKNLLRHIRGDGESMEKRSRTDLNRQKRPLWNVQNEPSSSQSEHFFFLVLFLRERLTNTNDVTSPRFSSLGTGSDDPGRVPSGHLWSFELPRYGDRLLPLSVTGCVFFFLYLDEHNHEIFPLREMTASFRLVGKGAKETEREGSPQSTVVNSPRFFLVCGKEQGGGERKVW